MMFFFYCVQGFNNDEVVVDWLLISVVDIVWLCQCYLQLDSGSQLCWYSSWLLLVVVIVDGMCGVVFIKCYYYSVCNVVCLEEEYCFIVYFVVVGVLVVQVLVVIDGYIVVEYGEWMFELYDVGVGDDLYCDVVLWLLLIDVVQVCEVGCVFVQLYCVVVSYYVFQCSIYLLVVCDDLICVDDLIVVIKVGLYECFGLVCYFVCILWEMQLWCDVLLWYMGLVECLYDELWLWVYNDWYVFNLLWCDGQVSIVLDFGLILFISVLFDFVIVIECNVVVWLELVCGMEVVCIDIVLVLFDGYCQVLLLLVVCVYLLVDLLLMVYFDFVLFEVEYFEGVIGLIVNVDVVW